MFGNPQLIHLPEAPADSSPIKQLGFLVGGTWIARGVIPNFGDAILQETCEWTLNQFFIGTHQKTARVDGSAGFWSLGRLGANLQTGKLLSWSFSSLGSYAFGEQLDPDAPEAQGTTWAFCGETVGTSTVRWINQLIQVSDDEFQTKTLTWNPSTEEYESAIELTYFRR